MKVSEYTVEFLANLISGDMTDTPYRSGPKLVQFFNEFGARDVYPPGGGFPSRRTYAQEKLRNLNGNVVFRQVILNALDPRIFLRDSFDLEPIITKVNENIKHDGYEVVPEGMAYKIRGLFAGQIKLESSAIVAHELSQLAIDENIKKCEQKLSDADYSGAITNARSLVESVLIGVEKDTDPNAIEYDGNLQSLYKRVQKHLNLAPDRKDIAEPLKQLLTGLISIIGGLAAIRNKMGDAHATSYRPAQHHAKLAVYAAITLSNFIFETTNYQKSRTKKPRE